MKGEVEMKRGDGSSLTRTLSSKGNTNGALLSSSADLITLGATRGDIGSSSEREHANVEGS